MIFVTGDTHGDWMTRLNSHSFPEGVGLTNDDYVIICGDFGLWHDTKEERHNLEWLDNKPFTTLFVCGNHENYDRLYEYPVEEWNGGKIHKIRDSVFHLMRGQVFDIQGKRFFTFGGASSHDVQDGIFTDELNDIPALCFRDTINNRDYITYLYLDDGRLKELFTADGSSAQANAGTMIASLSDFQIEEKGNGFYYIFLQSTVGNTSEFFLHSSAD